MSSRRPGDEPLVLIAPSTAHDRAHRLLRAALAGLDARAGARAGDVEPPPARRAAVRVPANARLVEWISYARTMPRCAVVVCHVGHGTMVRALASGATVVACPVAGDMAENAARLDWAGAGVRLPWRFATPRGVRLAVRRALAEPAVDPARRRVRGVGARDTTAPSGRRTSSRSSRAATDSVADGSLRCRCCAASG